MITPFSAGGTVNHGRVLFRTFGEIIDCMEKIRVGRELRKLEFRFTWGTRVLLDGKDLEIDREQWEDFDTRLSIANISRRTQKRLASLTEGATREEE